MMVRRTFFCLYLFPIFAHFIFSAGRYICKYMRVAADHFLGYASGDIIEIKQIFVCCYLGMKHNLQQ